MTVPIVLCVAAALIDADNRVLIQKRPEGKEYAGFWEFPGGKIEPNETPEQALVRELKEELDINTVIKALFPISFISHARPDKHIVMPLFGIRNWAGLPTPQIQQELAWVRVPRLADYNILTSNIPLIAPLMALI